MNRICISTMALLFPLISGDLLNASDPSTRQVAVWPTLAPKETSGETGTVQPPRPGEDPPVTRVTHIRQPMLDVFLPEKPNGSGVIILPGGGFGKVVTDKEGSEAGVWLNELGVTAFVLRYRTNEVTTDGEPSWLRPLQDAQRSIRLVRARAKEWQLDPAKIGVLGFSAGGQVASILHTRQERSDYMPIDDTDRLSCRPDFSLLIYPWQIYDEKAGDLLPEIQAGPGMAPAFIVHTHDDRSSSLGSVLLYAGLKRHQVPAELHVYQNGGHGYGMRPVSGSQIGTWPDRAAEWLKIMNYADSAE
ncbi:MAG: alpha/beta hydrolase [Planctomycetaceae bacterium]|nr:alpha/beta hydrolase [Planctomycetaceae bacterium]